MGAAHAVWREFGEAFERERKQTRRDRMRHGRERSNSVRRMGCKRLDDGRRLVPYQDDAPRFNMRRACSTGPPAGTPSRRRTRQHPDAANRCHAVRPRRPVPRRRIRKKQGGFRVRETPGGLGRTARADRGGPAPARRQAGAGARGDAAQPDLFHDAAGLPGICPVNPPHIETDPAARFARRRNREWPHMSLNANVEETPAMAFERKTPPPISDAAGGWWAPKPVGDA